jgi:hypothetical protein
MTVFDELIAPAMPIIQQIEHDRPKHHNEDLTWSDFSILSIIAGRAPAGDDHIH